MYIKSQNDVLLNSIQKYFDENGEDYNKMVEIINKKSIISLRIIDFFITNYSKNNKIKIGDFYIHQEYKNQLKGYHKSKFDPFCRKLKDKKDTSIKFEHKNGIIEMTTIGQLNLFRWVLKNGIIDYIENNYYQIDQELNKKTRINNKSKKISLITEKKDENTFVVSGLL